MVSSLRPLLVLVLAASASLPLPAAEDTVLTITGDLIAPLALSEEKSAEERIGSYYALLPLEKENRALALRKSLDGLIEDYEVAFSAADTAEVNNVLSDLGYHWAALRTIHAEYFMPAAVAHIQQAYGELYPMIAITDGTE